MWAVCLHDSIRRNAWSKVGTPFRSHMFTGNAYAISCILWLLRSILNKFQNVFLKLCQEGMGARKGLLEGFRIRSREKGKKMKLPELVWG